MEGALLVGEFAGQSMAATNQQLPVYPQPDWHLIFVAWGSTQR
jgi:hypothetical protein